ncbi:carboxylesterase family protein [Chelativorans salis]|uniref:Carboxylic ester hydrolase n=1 Tax=Chelativorans salis TaxID=2978478 RepID=A0ABT2LQ97_9HYPH|nr:carboxylesterase family protein [Chelativorans sp. EGI FJ00035]MCT7376731.1 carboxylesterase family protein [Chelativorans sp. EGI FJ00035]
MITALRGALLVLGLYGLAGMPHPSAAQSAAGAKNNPVEVVKVEGGLVKGVPSDTPGVQVFKGVPFAGNVGGKNRWKPAPPVEPWEGVLAADEWGDPILQDEEISSDEGLNLAVWTPAKSTNDQLPVYMMIHGGANRLGSASAWDFLNASELAAQGVVVVSVQYRLGAQGFLSLPEMKDENPDGLAGNFAILDLVTALHWIKDNIAGFGGDPELVTIGGQSAGGENTVALLRTPLAKGLLKRAFIQSSFTGFLPGKVVPFEEKAVQNQEAVNEIFGKETSLEDLRQIDAETWKAKWKDTDSSLYNTLARAAATNQFYTIDGYSTTEDSVNLLQPGDFDGLDIIIGQTADEYTGLRPANREMTEEEQHEAMLSAIRPYQAGSVDESVFPLYASDDPVERYRLSLRMLNDFMFQYVKIGAEHAKAHSDANVYLFYWDHWPPGKDQGFRRAWHAADLWYFNAAIRKDNPDQRRWTWPDLEMKRIASTYLANFIKTGDPNGHSVPRWGQVSNGQFLRFHEGEVEMRTNTVHPDRDEYLRQRILEGMQMTEADLDG